MNAPALGTTAPTFVGAVLPVTARVPFGTKDALKELKPLFRAEQRRARALSRTAEWSVEGLGGREAAERRTAWYAHRARLREDGQLLDCLDAVVTLQVRTELRRRGWDRPWPPVPAQALLPGRWPGSRDGGYPEKVPVRLPAGLVEQVRAGCWHTSAEAIGLLRDWRDRHPDALPTRAFRSQREEKALAEYERLAAQVTTTGQIWRAAITRLAEAAPALLQRAVADSPATAEAAAGTVVQGSGPSSH